MFSLVVAMKAPFSRLCVLRYGASFLRPFRKGTDGTTSWTVRHTMEERGLLSQDVARHAVHMGGVTVDGRLVEWSGGVRAKLG